PMRWASAYGALVLARAQAAGVPVSEPEFNSLLNYLQIKLVEPGNLNADSLCLGACALAAAQRADFSLHTRLYGERDSFSTEDRALLALAIATGEKDLNHARTLLQKPATRAPQALAPFAGGSREKAIQLLAWTACDPQAPITQKLFHELDAQRRQGHWSTTQGNAWALMAMDAYLRQQSPTPGNLAGAIRCGAEQQAFQLTPGCGVTTHAFTFSTNSAAPLTITNASSGSLYAELRVESRLTQPQVQAQDHGFKLERTYARLNDKNQPEPAAAWRVGDRVLVTLNVSVPESAQYVALEDPLPGVLEAINPEFQPPASAAQEPASTWYSDYREIRADRVLFFANQLPQGHYVVRYLARVRAAGLVTAPAAKIEAMYQPNRFGLSQSLTISSRPLN
ncbi:MAG TPA: hypothetical protein VN673_03500, partial [Clostridia bacterium]|nr:hypothetical protein [Clostridia bacterium]